VSREELRREIWGESTFVDFELGLNYALSRLRGILGDEARSPRLVETVRGRGLRFMAPVECRRAERPTLAVLPFQDVAGDPQHAFLAEGLADLLTTELAKVASLRVISRQSVRHLRNCDRSAAQIARELAADVLVEGTVLVASGRLRFSVQAIEVEPERHVWADSFEGDLAEALPLQARAARAVARALAISLTSEEEARLAEQPGTTLEAQTAYLKARQHLGRHTRRDMEAGLAYLKEAVAADPGFAAAHAQLALCLSWMAFWGHAPARDAYRRARQAALRALELDPASGAAHLAVGRCRIFVDWDLDGAEESCRRSLALNPSNEGAWLLNAFLRSWGRGDRVEALAATERALSLDPVSAQTGSTAAWLFLFVGEHARALALARHTLELHPGTAQALHVRGWVHARDRRWAEAVDAFEHARAISPDPFTLAFLAETLPRLGRRDEAVGLLGQLRRLAQQGVAPARSVAFAHAGLGDMDQAFEWLERGFEERDPALLGLRVSPPFELLSHHPRFDALVERVRQAVAASQP
jgi:TolB-like protein